MNEQNKRKLMFRLIFYEWLDWNWIEQMNKNGRHEQNKRFKKRVNELHFSFDTWVSNQLFKAM